MVAMQFRRMHATVRNTGLALVSVGVATTGAGRRMASDFSPGLVMVGR